MPDLGDTLLYALSAKGDLSWRAFRSTFNSLAVHADVSGNVVIENSRFSRLATLKCLDELGHCDVAWAGGAARIMVAPPVLAALPLPGLPRAVVCGARAPQTLKDIREHVAGLSVSAAVRAERHTPARGVAPMRIEIMAASADELGDIATSVGISYAPVPPAWQLAELSGSLDEYLSSLQWTEDPEINWPRSDFHAESIGFGEPAEFTGRLRLSRYTDPVGGSRRYYLRNGNLSNVEVEPDWGRFAVLADTGFNVLAYNEDAFTLSVPLYLPLPRLLARALALCSGKPPALQCVGASPLLAANPWREYRSVPREVAAVVADKLGQNF